MHRISLLPKKAKMAAAAVAAVLVLVGLWWWLVASPVETGASPDAAPQQTAIEVQELQIPEAYLFHYFLAELHDCYGQIGHSITLPELERQVGKEWGMAAVALVDYYTVGKCSEGELYLRIPGRVAWMIDQVQEMAVEDEEKAAN